MADLLMLLVGTILVNNIVLSHYLGLTPLMGAGNSVPTALSLAVLTAVVLIASSVINYGLYHFLLVPFELQFLRTLCFMLVIAALTGALTFAVQKERPLLKERLGRFLPLIAGNSAVLGVALLNVESGASFPAALLFSIGAAAGFALILVLFASLRERLAVVDVPAPFQGSAISLITAGLMALAFMGFAGLV